MTPPQAQLCSLGPGGSQGIRRFAFSTMRVMTVTTVKATTSTTSNATIVVLNIGHPFSHLSPADIEFLEP